MSGIDRVGPGGREAPEMDDAAGAAPPDEEAIGAAARGGKPRAPAEAGPGSTLRGALSSRIDALASISRRVASGTGGASTIDEFGRTVRTWSDAEGSHHEVAGIAAGGGRAEARTTVREGGGVRSEVEIRRPDGSREAWTFEDSFRDDSLDRATVRRTDPSGREIEARDVAPAEFLAAAGRAFRVETPGVDFKDPLRLTYASEYTSCSTVASGRGPDGKAAHVVASLGVHAAFPFPGSHWDEGQIAILDEAYQPKLTLRMPEDLEASHLSLRFEDGRDPKTGEATKTIRYQGYMEDDQGKLRFVEAEFHLRAADVAKRDPGLWDKLTGALNDAVGFDQNARVLSELRGATPSTLKVDGKKVLDISESLTAVDDQARMNLLLNNRHAAINYAPPGSPLLSLIDPKEKEARYRYDATLLDDTTGLISRLIPAAVRRGTLGAHYVSDASGRRRDVSERLTPDGPPLSSKSYVWKVDGRPAAILTRELVRYRDEKGNIELGFRETIRKA